jgi:hypothetical protein
MGGFAIQNSNGALRSVNAMHFLKLLSKGTIVLPNITRIQIKEKNKGNGLAKL